MTIASSGDTFTYNQGNVSRTAELVATIAGPVGVGAGEYETVAASQTDQAMGATGAAGDWLDKLIITVGTAASSTVSIKDGGGSSIPILPAAVGGGIGVYVVAIGLRSVAGAWKVTTGAGATVIACGDFT